MKAQQIQIIFLCILFMNFNNNVNAQESTAQKFKKLDWLIGKWQRSNAKAGQSGYETWNKVSSSKVVGRGFTLEGEKIVFEEQLELSIKDDQIFYTVSVAGDPKPVAFKLTSITNDAFVCENPDHDFPKKIAYTRDGLGIKAVISGEGRSVDFNFQAQVPAEHGHAEINGMKMYYEILGAGRPLVLIHGGGSTIESNFGRIIPMLAKNRMVIAVELQAHGRTSDRNADLTFEQDADDIAALLNHLKIDKADFLGFSNGGTTTLQLAIRHPKIVNKIILASALSKRTGVPSGFWDFMKQAKLENMPQELKEAYLAVAAKPAGLQVMHDRDAKRMVNFKDISDKEIEAIKAPALILIGDKDVITAEHAIEMHKLIIGSELAIIPGLHGEYIEEVTTLKNKSRQASFVVPMIESFLDK